MGSAVRRAAAAAATVLLAGLPASAGALPASEVRVPADAAAPAGNPDCLTAAALDGDAEAAFECLNGPSAPGAASSGVQSLIPRPPCTQRPGYNDRCEEWYATYNDPEVPENSYQFPAGIALAPDDATVYIAASTQLGDSWDTTSRWAVLAFDAADGRLLWESKWGDPAEYSFPSDITVAPDGTIFATGTTRESYPASDGTVLTMAFEPSGGDILWTSAYRGPGNGVDNGRGILTSPDGSSVFVAAVSDGDPSNQDLDYAMLGIDARTGEQRWVYRYEGLGRGGTDSPFDIAIHPRGDLVYATGWSAGHGQFDVDYGTIAVRTTGADAGTLAWEARYDGTGTRGPDQAYSLAASPDGNSIVVTGMSHDARSGPPFPVDYKFATVAYDAHSGDRLWEGRRGWDGTSTNYGTAVTIDRAGRTFVSGQTAEGGVLEFGVVAYDVSGAELWADRYATPEHDFELPRDILASPDGSQVFVTGVSSDSRSSLMFAGQGQLADQLTIAYDAGTGTVDWLARWNATGYDFDVGRHLAMPRDGSTLFVGSALTHNIELDRNFYDVGLTAYSLDGDPGGSERDTELAFTEDADENGQHTDDVTFEVSLSEGGGAPLEGEEITFTLEGESAERFFTALTDENGVASARVTLTEQPGSYVLSASYEGRPDEYSPSQASRDFTVLRGDSQLELWVGEGTGPTRPLIARLSDLDDPSYGIVGRTIRFYVNGELLGSATTDDDGRASIEIHNRHRNQRLEAFFDGDDYFGNSAARTGRS